MNIIGISEGFHDAAICVIRERTILHASHSERYSGIKTINGYTPPNGLFRIGINQMLWHTMRNLSEKI